MAMATTFLHSLIAIAFVYSAIAITQHETQFTYNGFNTDTNDSLLLDGLAQILPNGLLQMTNYTHNTSHAFYPHPITFRPTHLSFSTTFVFAITPLQPNNSGDGIVFLISPTSDFKQALSPSNLGLFQSDTQDGQPSNHIFAIELDTRQTEKFGDIDGNHVGIDVNSLKSIDASSASYYSDKEGKNKTLLLNSGKRIQIWIDYDETNMLVNVTLAPLGHSKPSECLLSKHFNLSAILLDSMYVGFSSAAGMIPNSHYILGWSWNQSGMAQGFDPSLLPSLPRMKGRKLSLDKLIILLLLILVFLLLFIIVIVVWVVWRKKYEELHEPWEIEYASHRFSYKELYVATKGFKNTEVLGVDGFGKVYKGILPSTKAHVAVKRISHDSEQGMKEFVAEISTMTRLCHRNIVKLLGYCRRKRELLIVYDYMPNGSLDQFLHSFPDKKSNLSWSLRFNIIKGVASALLYLHEEGEQVVLHRDVKASNVLLDGEMNARLGDFGLARLYEHNKDPRTTHVVGTIGYIAPEMNRTLKPTTNTDVFAFGMFLLEVVCGRRPIGKQGDNDEAEALFLSDWVYNCWKRGEILKAIDPKMTGEYKNNEKELVLKLGLVCLNPNEEARPKMRQVVQFLNGSENLPDMPSYYNPDICFFQQVSAKSGLLPSSTGTGTETETESGTVSLSIMSSTNSVLRYGR